MAILRPRLHNQGWEGCLMMNHTGGWMNGWMGGGMWFSTAIGVLVVVLLVVVIIKLSKKCIGTRYCH